MFDIILKNGKIIDGSGNCWCPGSGQTPSQKLRNISTSSGEICTRGTPVMVNGKLVISEGTHIGATPGRLLKAA